MRLIDTDTAKRTYTADLFDTEEDFERVNDIFDYAPTIDAVPVVRCRECRWYDVGKNDSESWSECTLRYGKYFNVSPMDFCSYGQRKEG